GSIGRMLDDPGLYDSLVKTVTAANAVITQISTSNGTLARLLHDDTLYTRFIGLATGADSIVKLVLHGNGSAQQMLTDRRAYDELLRSIEALNAVLDDLRKNPRRYLQGLVKVF